MSDNPSDPKVIMSLSSSPSPLLDPGGDPTPTPNCSTLSNLDLDLDPFPTFSNTSTLSPCVNSTSSLPTSFLQMSELSLYCVIAYSIIFLISAGGNISVFFSVLKQLRQTKNRISLLILHLCVADLLVTFTAMPMEILWRITIQWYGGNVLCKLCQFLRAFGLYGSSMVVICISLDRYFAIIYPLKLARAAERAKITLALAWVAALVCAAPQAIIFHVESHPQYPSFKQCVTESFLRSDLEQELVYNVFSVSVLYFVPLLIILFTYFRIVLKISHKSLSRDKMTQQMAQDDENYGQQRRSLPSEVSIGYHINQNNLGRKTSSVVIIPGQTQPRPSQGDMTLTSTTSNGHVPYWNEGHEMTEVSLEPSHKVVEPRSSTASGGVTGATGQGHGRKFFLRTSISGGVLMARARIKTLRLTCVIVLTFIICWSPYVVMTLWYMIDREGAKGVDKRIQEGLFLMAVSNSVMNPLIYGTYGSSNCGRGSSHGKKCRPYTMRKGQRGQSNPSPSSQQRRSLGCGTGGPATMTSVILTHHLYNQNGGVDRKASVI